MRDDVLQELVDVRRAAGPTRTGAPVVAEDPEVERRVEAAAPEHHRAEEQHRGSPTKMSLWASPGERVVVHLLLRERVLVATLRRVADVVEPVLGRAPP